MYGAISWDARSLIGHSGCISSWAANRHRVARSLAGAHTFHLPPWLPWWPSFLHVGLSTPWPIDTELASVEDKLSRIISRQLSVFQECQNLRRWTYLIIGEKKWKTFLRLDIYFQGISVIWQFFLVWARMLIPYRGAVINKYKLCAKFRRINYNPISRYNMFICLKQKRTSLIGFLIKKYYSNIFFSLIYIFFF